MKLRTLALLLAFCLLLGVPVLANNNWDEDWNDKEQWDDSDVEYQEGVGWDAEVLRTDVASRNPGEEDWFRRSELPDYAVNLYAALLLGSDVDSYGNLLIRDRNFRLAASNNAPPVGQTVEAVEETVYTDPAFYDGETVVSAPVTVEALLDESNNQIDPGIADKSVRYSSLVLGDLVRTSSFNGILVYKIKKTDNPNFDAELLAARDAIVESYHAFDRDHPEVFWLSGKSKVRIVTATTKSGDKKVQTAYLFFVLADDSGFSLRAENYNSAARIGEAAKLRDEAAEAILAPLKELDTLAQIKALNEWLTTHNEYNTTEDLSTIGYAPHRCLSALTGSVGTDGPVCDGYSRAFKLLCDRLGIPCLLENGFARSSAEHAGEYHMWNTVRMPDEKWYGVDVTWDDPKVPGVSGAVSGKENENFLLVGNKTEIQGLLFEESHKPTDQLTALTALDGTILSPTAYAGAVAEPEPELPFTDVKEENWFYPYVKFIYEKGIMSGTGEGIFAPNATTTRAQLVTMLYRLEGKPEVSDEAVFDDVPAGEWYSAPVTWANEKGIVTGYGDGTFGPHNTLTREQLALMLWRYADKPEGEGDLDQFADADKVDTWAADALRWCVGKGIITGKGGGILDPLGDANRAEIATMLMRFMQLED